MKAIAYTNTGSPNVLHLKGVEKAASGDDEMNEMAEAFAELKRGVQAALETYSNVHRGSGLNSMVSTHLFEQARDIVLEYLGLNKSSYVVIFCTPRRAEMLKACLRPNSYRILSSQDIGLSLGVRAVAVKRGALPRGVPFQTGGGTARLVYPGSVIWARSPDKFEAGTPAIVNVIAFARALQLVQHFGKDVFQEAAAKKQTVDDILCHDPLEAYSGQELLNELRQTQTGRGLQVPTTEGIRPYVNLDNAASTPTFTPIWNAVWQTWQQPASVQQAIIHEVKSICADVLGAPLTAYDVIFTSNTTEAINLAAENLSHAFEPGVEPMVLNTLLEHNSNELPWRTMAGVSLIRFPVDDEGFVDLNELEMLLCAYNEKEEHGKQRIKLVTVSGASNVLGTFNDLAEIGRIAHHYGARLLVDAAQLVAHRKVEMEKCGIDYLVFSAHKVYAPFGSGALMVRNGLLHFSPAQLELIQSSGEENAGGIAALGKALLLLQRISLDTIQTEEQVLTGRILHGLGQIPGVTIYGIKDPDSPQFARKGGVIAFNLDGLMANRVAKELAERGGIGVRSGCHCAHLLIKHLLKIPKPLTLVQGVVVTLFPRVALPGVARVSLGIENSADDADTFIRVLGNIAQQPKARVDKPLGAAQPDIQRQMDDFVSVASRRVYAQLN